MPDIFVDTSSEEKHEPEKPTPLPPLKAAAADIEPAIAKKPHNHAFATFCAHPNNVWFHDKRPDEDILLLLRKHLVTNIPWIVFTLVLLLIPPILFGFFSSSLGQSVIIPETVLPMRYIMILTLFYYLVVLGYGLVSFITWFYNVSLITSKRVVDIDYSDVIYHNVAATKLNLIQDVDYTQSGFIRSLFNYGDVFVQTASGAPNFDFLAVPRPSEVANIIESLIGRKPYTP